MALKENSRFEARRVMCLAIVAAIVLGVPNRSASATEFNKPLNVSRSRTRIDTGAAIAVDPNNKVHIAWNAFYPKAGAPDGVAGDIYYATNVSGKFSAPVRIRVPAGWYSRDPSIAVDGNGHAHIVFRRSMNQMFLMSDDDLYYVTNAKGDFKHPILLVDGKYGISGQVSGPSDPRVHCDSRGRVHLTFLADIGYQGDLVVYMNNRSGAWTKPALAVQGDFLIMHSSCLDRNGFIHIAYMSIDKKYNHHRIYYANNRTGKFSEPLVASYSKHWYASEPQVAVDRQGKAHLVYRATIMPGGGGASLFYVNNVAGSFKSWKAVCDMTVYYIPQIAVDSSNVVHIAYKISPAFGGHFYYGNNSTGKFTFSSYEELGVSAYGWPQYFALGKNGSLHFAVYDFPNPHSLEAEIYYIAGSWAK